MARSRSPITIQKAWDNFWKAWFSAPIEEQQEFAQKVARQYWLDLNRHIAGAKFTMIEGEWDIRHDVDCDECGKRVPRAYRLVKKDKYNKVRDRRPEYRCEECSIRKYEELRKKGKV